MHADPIAPARRRHRALFQASAVATVAGLALGATAMTSSAATPAKKAKSTGGSIAGVPASAIPKGTPNLHGLSVTIEDQGSPDPSRITDYNVVRLLNRWGAHAKLIWAPSQQVATSALLNGSADVLFSTIPNQLPTVVSGLNIHIFGVNNPRLDYALIGVGNTTSMSQLKGKNVGVLTGGPSDIVYVLIQQALRTAGISMSQVNVVQTGGQTVRESALASGRIEATAVGHYAMYVLRSLHPHILYDFTTQDPSLNNDFIWASPRWLQHNAKMAVAIDLAELETYKWFNTPKNKNAVLVEMAADSPGATMQSAQTLYAIYRKYGVLAPGSAVSTSSLLAQEKFYVKAGTLDGMLALSRWASPQYDQAALQAYKKTNS